MDHAVEQADLIASGMQRSALAQARAMTNARRLPVFPVESPREREYRRLTADGGAAIRECRDYLDALGSYAPGDEWFEYFSERMEWWRSEVRRIARARAALGRR